MKCKHCGQEVIFTGHKAKGFTTDYMHANLIRRCLPAYSGKPYGLEADVEILTRDSDIEDEDIDDTIDAMLDVGSEFR